LLVNVSRGIAAAAAGSEGSSAVAERLAAAAAEWAARLSVPA
jgi:hypothetical protein